jgi:hypothetical protein
MSQQPYLLKISFEGGSKDIYKLAIQDLIQVKLLRRNMEWFDYSIPLCPPGRVGFERIRCHGTHVAHPTQRRDLW